MCSVILCFVEQYIYIPTPLLVDLGITLFLHWGTTQNITFKMSVSIRNSIGHYGGRNFASGGRQAAKLCQQGATPTPITPSVLEFYFLVILVYCSGLLSLPVCKDETCQPKFYRGIIRLTEKFG